MTHILRALLVLVPTTTLAFTVACASDVGVNATGPTGGGETPTEGEGESATEGEGEGVIGNEGEGEGATEGEGEGTLLGEGEGEGDIDVPPPPADLGCNVDVCTGGPPTSSVVFTPGAQPSVRVDGGAAITVGTSTRSNVEAQLGAGANADEFGFRVRYCDVGIEVQYVDSDGVFDGASPQNRVARIVTLAGADASAGPYNVGANAPLLGNEQIFVADAGTVRFDPARGLQAAVDDNGTVTNLVMFRPQDASRDWGVAFMVAASESSLGGIRAAGQDFGNGDNFASLASVIGDDFDADGSAAVEVSGFEVDIHVRVYAALGIRVAGACGFDGCDDDDEISSITLSPPYAGAFGSVSLGDSRSTIDGALGAGNGPDANGIVAYSGFSSDFGVSYVESGPCAGRAAMFVLGYDPP